MVVMPALMGLTKYGRCRGTYIVYALYGCYAPPIGTHLTIEPGRELSICVCMCTVCIDMHTVLVRYYVGYIYNVHVNIQHLV